MALPIVWSPVVDQHKQMECTCAPCKAFWKRAFQDGADRITRGSNERAECTGTLGNQKGLLRKGDRVVVQGKLPGVVQYVGYADDHLVAPEMHVGVCLYDNAYTTHNGVYRGKRFFNTPRGHAAMVKYSEISPLNAIPRTRNVNGNAMFPSFDIVKKKRREREEKIRKEEEQLRQEHETRRRAQMERYSRSAPPPTFSPRPTRASKMRTEGVEPKPRQPLQDEYDIAYRDYQRQERLRQSRRTLNVQTQEEKEFRQLKKAFGGDEKAERMAETYKKLQRAFEEGKVVAFSEKE